MLSRTMPSANVSWGIAALLAAGLLGCRGPTTYTQAIVARTDAGPVLVVLDNTRTDWVSTVDIATGKRSERRPLGDQGSCLPSMPGRIWCGYTAGEDQFEHEAWDLATLDYLADNSAIAANSPSSFTEDQIQINQGVRIRATDHALVLSNADPDAPDGDWAVDPKTFAVSPFTFDEGDEVIPSLDSDDILAGRTSSSVHVGDSDYWVDDETWLLQKGAAGSGSFAPLNQSQTFFVGQFALLDGYDWSAGPVVAQGPESVFLISFLSEDSGTVGSWVARVGTADGQVLWKVQLPEAQWVDTVASAGGVLAVVERLTAYAAPGAEQLPIHARVLGLDLQTGATRWKLDI
jgi:hypothetical protein